ncbi:uncharacterized protein EI90DRAFT_3129183 [Cantharellus anzutake]|uniref:uncharacterized protein n=1 Tax=Cantharellus anzutake TaxID=1750568 RepID=UPI0019087CD0|nr:uncharacterized protein EI90DRAFT_3129183 [Cantharellus anzutake]KAF8325077.1 hypothetical protein EI90DRAFT_3129183 [Cantharellus anzutake]
MALLLVQKNVEAPSAEAHCRRRGAHPSNHAALRYPALRHVAVVALLTPATARSDRSIDSAHDRHTCSTNSYTSYPWRRRGGPKRVTRKTVRPSRDQDTTRSLDDTLSIPQPPMPPSLVSTGYNFGLKLLSWFIARPSFFPHDEEGDHVHEDDTGKKNFDFTGELNRLNQGGVRLSFVETVGRGFQGFLSDSGSASESRATSPASLDWELPAEPKRNLNRTWELNPGLQFGMPTAPLNIAAPTKGLHSRTNIETGNLTAREIEFLEDLDTSMCTFARVPNEPP